MQKRGAIQSQPGCVTRSQPHLLQQVQQLVPDITRHAVQVRGAVRPVWSLDFDAPDDAVEKGRLVVHPPEVALGKALHCGHGVSWAEVCSRAAATQVAFFNGATGHPPCNHLQRGKLTPQTFRQVPHRLMPRTRLMHCPSARLQYRQQRSLTGQLQPRSSKGPCITACIACLLQE